MPEVRSGYYKVKVDTAGFTLQHPSRIFSQAEERDILLTEMSLAFDTHRPPIPVAAFDRMIIDWPTLNNADFIQVLRGSADHYLSVFREPALLPEDAYKTGFAFSRVEFQQVRAALMALADYCLGMASAAERQWQSASLTKRNHWERECKEWTAPLLSKNFILGTTQALAGIDAKVLDLVMDYFTMDAEQGDFQNAGDGYLPPFIALGSSFIFSPYALKTMLPERNLLYVINKRNRTRFDELISAHLEPALLEEAARLIAQIPGVEVAKNVKWTGGEIDILVFQSSSKVAMHVQAKAALPPQGARMTRRIEDQTLKAVDQLKRFDAKSAKFRNELCARTFGKEIVPLSWVSGILSRSSLGTAKAWSAVEGIAILNPLLLTGAVSRIMADSKLSLADLPNITQTLVREITNRAVKGWTNNRINIFGTEVEVPLLDLDYEQITKIRHQLFFQS